MAVPDWPNSFGYNMFAFPISKWVGGVHYEHPHRLIASLAGLLTSILCVWLWCRETTGRERWTVVGGVLAMLVLMGLRQLPVYFMIGAVALAIMVYSLSRAVQAADSLRWLGLLAFGAVVLQGILGGLRVVLFRDEIGIFHATLAQLFLLLICAIALMTSRFWLGARERFAQVAPAPRIVQKLFVAATALIFVQLFLGATMRHQHAGLAIADFPLAYGKLWPAMDAGAITIYNQQRMEIVGVKEITAFQVGLQMVHRLMAGAILAVVLAAAFSSLRGLGGRHPLTRIAFAWVAIVVMQAFLGAATIWTKKAADIATAHVLMGAASLVTGGLSWLLIRTCFRSAAEPALSRSYAAGCLPETVVAMPVAK
jgi:cytochrome c oxidase assembly protein subunit 15